MCDGEHAAQEAVVVVVLVVVDGSGCLPFGWPTNFGRQIRKDRGRSEGRTPAAGACVCTCTTSACTLPSVHRWSGVHMVPRSTGTM